MSTRGKLCKMDEKREDVTEKGTKKKDNGEKGNTG
jgi:hypothetical protein